MIYFFTPWKYNCKFVISSEEALSRGIIALIHCSISRRSKPDLGYGLGDRDIGFQFRILTHINSEALKIPISLARGWFHRPVHRAKELLIRIALAGKTVFTIPVGEGRKKWAPDSLLLRIRGEFKLITGQWVQP